MSNVRLIYARVCDAFEVLAQNAVRKSFKFLRACGAAKLSAPDDIHLSLMDHDIHGFHFNSTLAGDTWVAMTAANFPTNF